MKSRLSVDLSKFNQNTSIFRSFLFVNRQPPDATTTAQWNMLKIDKTTNMPVIITEKGSNIRN